MITYTPRSPGRREFLRSALMGLASQLGAACAPLPGIAAQPGPARAGLLVDTHCHVFNASDLPVRGFVQRVALGDEEKQVVLGPTGRALLPWIGATLIEILGSGAKSAADELAEMSRTGRELRRFEIVGKNSDIDTVSRALQAVLGESSDRARTLRESDIPRDSAGRDALLQRIGEETGSNVQKIDVRAVAEAQNVARALLGSNGAVSRQIQWAVEMTRDRRELVDRLVSLYTPPAGFALFTPALIDFSAWLGEDPQSSVADQIRVMENIQRRQTAAAVHCFVPFDPWRQVLDVESRSRPTSLELVQWATQEMGFVGIKLYPPMGFLPIDNRLVKQGYPVRAAEIRDFPAKLDGALNAVYAYAETNGVAIMAHTTDSNGAAPGYSGRAHPAAWKPVLRAYPRLRLNFGHFGDFDEARAHVPHEPWETEIGRMIGVNSGIFADLSYLAELLPGRDADTSAGIRVALADFIKRYDAKMEHLMYGSDWIMLGREVGHELYATTLTVEMSKILGDDTRISNFLSRNAVRYLGLRRGEQTRARLDRYYSRHRMNSAWLAYVDKS